MRASVCVRIGVPSVGSPGRTIDTHGASDPDARLQISDVTMQVGEDKQARTWLVLSRLLAKIGVVSSPGNSPTTGQAG